SIKVVQRTFNPLNRERCPGGPPKLPGRPIEGLRPLKARMLVRFRPRQPLTARYLIAIMAILVPTLYLMVSKARDQAPNVQEQITSLVLDLPRRSKRRWTP